MTDRLISNRSSGGAIQFSTNVSGTPTLDGYVTNAGAWTLGPSGATASTTHAVNGPVRFSALGGFGALAIGQAGTVNYPSVTFNALPTTTNAVYTRLVNDTATVISLGANTIASSALEVHAFTTGTSTPLTISATTAIGAASTAGAWILGPSLGASNTAHTFKLQSNAGSQNLIKLTSSFGATYPSIIADAGVTSAVALNADSANNLGVLSFVNEFRFYSDTYAHVSGNSLYGTQVGGITAAGAWTLGFNGFTGKHTMYGSLWNNTFFNNAGSGATSTFTTTVGQGMCYCVNANSGEAIQIFFGAIVAIASKTSTNWDITGSPTQKITYSSGTFTVTRNAAGTNTYYYFIFGAG